MPHFPIEHLRLSGWWEGWNADSKLFFTSIACRREIVISYICRAPVSTNVRVRDARKPIPTASVRKCSPKKNSSCSCSSICCEDGSTFAEQYSWSHLATKSLRSYLKEKNCANIGIKDGLSYEKRNHSAEDCQNFQTGRTGRGLGFKSLPVSGAVTPVTLISPACSNLNSPDLATALPKALSRTSSADVTTPDRSRRHTELPHMKNCQSSPTPLNSTPLPSSPRRFSECLANHQSENIAIRLQSSPPSSKPTDDTYKPHHYSGYSRCSPSEEYRPPRRFSRSPLPSVPSLTALVTPSPSALFQKYLIVIPWSTVSGIDLNQPSPSQINQNPLGFLSIETRAAARMYLVEEDGHIEEVTEGKEASRVRSSRVFGLEFDLNRGRAHITALLQQMAADGECKKGGLQVGLPSWTRAFHHWSLAWLYGIRCMRFVESFWDYIFTAYLLFSLLVGLYQLYMAFPFLRDVTEPITEWLQALAGRYTRVVTWVLREYSFLLVAMLGPVTRIMEAFDPLRSLAGQVASLGLSVVQFVVRPLLWVAFPLQQVLSEYVLMFKEGITSVVYGIRSIHWGIQTLLAPLKMLMFALWSTLEVTFWAATHLFSLLLAVLQTVVAVFKFVLRFTPIPYILDSCVLRLASLVAKISYALKPNIYQLVNARQFFIALFNKLIGSILGLKGLNDRSNIINPRPWISSLIPPGDVTSHLPPLGDVTDPDPLPLSPLHELDELSSLGSPLPTPAGSISYYEDGTSCVTSGVASPTYGAYGHVSRPAAHMAMRRLTSARDVTGEGHASSESGSDSDRAGRRSRRRYTLFSNSSSSRRFSPALSDPEGGRVTSRVGGEDGPRYSPKSLAGRHVAATSSRDSHLLPPQHPRDVTRRRSGFGFGVGRGLTAEALRNGLVTWLPRGRTSREEEDDTDDSGGGTSRDVTTTKPAAADDAGGLSRDVTPPGERGGALSRDVTPPGERGRALFLDRTKTRVHKRHIRKDGT